MHLVCLNFPVALTNTQGPPHPWTLPGMSLRTALIQTYLSIPAECSTSSTQRLPMNHAGSSPLMRLFPLTPPLLASSCSGSKRSGAMAPATRLNSGLRPPARRICTLSTGTRPAPIRLTASLSLSRPLHLPRWIAPDTAVKRLVVGREPLGERTE